MNVSKFSDGFGNRRIFCRRCWGSWLEQSVIEFGNMKEPKMMKSTFYQNNRALRGSV